MDNRKHKRFDSGNLLSYVCLDDSDKVVQQGMGKTLDVSEGGMLLETHVPISSGSDILLSIGLRDEMVDIRGDIIYWRKRDDDMVESGIRFVNVSSEGLSILHEFIKRFHA